MTDQEILEAMKVILKPIHNKLDSMEIKLDSMEIKMSEMQS